MHFQQVLLEPRVLQHVFGDRLQSVVVQTQRRCFDGHFVSATFITQNVFPSPCMLQPAALQDQSSHLLAASEDEEFGID